MTVQLGWSGIDIEIILAHGQDWIVTLEAPDNYVGDVFPDGTTIVANIYPPGTDKLPLAQWPAPDASWPATITDNRVVQWKVESADTEDTLDRSVARVMVSYPNTPTTDDYRWLKGLVVRRD